MRGQVLSDASRVINGERQDTYGNPEDSFVRIASLWNWWLSQKGSGIVVSRDVAMMMALMKIAREANGHKADNIVDACGYLALYNDMVDAPTVLTEAGSENLPKSVSEDLPGFRQGDWMDEWAEQVERKMEGK